MQTLDQKLAVHFYQAVSKHKSASQTQKTDYGIWAKKLPGLAAQSGLVSAFALAENKADKKDGIKLLLNDLKSSPDIKELLGKETNLLSESLARLDVLDYIVAHDLLDRALDLAKAFSVSILNVDIENLEQDNE